jgi:prolyl 4-hydroxylase
VFFELSDALSAPDCEDLIATFAGKLQRSAVLEPATGERLCCEGRTSHGAKVERAERPSALVRLSRSVAALCGCAESHLERWELLRYRVGEHFAPHFDTLPGDTNPRAFSAVVFLHAPAEGGALVFPRLRRIVRPRVGAGVVWRNDGDSLHASMRVLAGEKWSLVTWVRERPIV